MIRVGVIGFGFMGGVHFRSWQANKNAQVVAICAANPITDKAKRGNIDAGNDELNLEGISIYTEIADLLASEKIDVVSITLPSYLHKSISIQCLDAGVHVLCEKPMALTVEDCDAMIAAANAAGKELMVGQCIRFWPVYTWIKQAVERGQFGSVRVADFSRLTYAPVWDANSWFSDSAKSGGIGLDLHIHDLDFIQHLFGIPKAIQASCMPLGNGVPGHVQTQLDYGDGRIISATASWMMPETFGFQMAFRIIFETAVAIFDGTDLTIYPAEGETYVQPIADGDGYQGEIDYFAAVLSGTNQHIEITQEQARESVRLALESTKK